MCEGALGPAQGADRGETGQRPWGGCGPPSYNKTTINRMKKQATDWEKYLSNIYVIKNINPSIKRTFYSIFIVI